MVNGSVHASHTAIASCLEPVRLKVVLSAIGTRHEEDAPRGADLHKLDGLIDDIGVATLTTKAADGSLMSRPQQTLKLDSQGEIIVFTAAKCHKLKQLTDDHGVNLAYADKVQSRYVSIGGRARLDRDVDSINELWCPTQKIFFPDGKDDPNLMLLRVRTCDAS